MGPRLDILGIGMLLTFIIVTQFLIVYRSVKSIKLYVRHLMNLKQDVVKKGNDTVHYERAHDLLMAIQRQKMERIKRSFWGRIFSVIVSKRYYEIHV